MDPVDIGSVHPYLVAQPPGFQMEMQDVTTQYQIQTERVIERVASHWPIALCTRKGSYDALFRLAVPLPLPAKRPRRHLRTNPKALISRDNPTHPPYIDNLASHCLTYRRHTLRIPSSPTFSQPL
jgi:hypothetical protein